MNFLKNLMIIAVLAAVGYGVYVSLQHNADSGQPSSAAEGWPAVPKIELPGAKSAVPPGGSLALSAPLAQPAAGGIAPPFTPPSAANPMGTLPGGAPGLKPVTPNPLPAPVASAGPASNPIATLGAPISPDAIATAPLTNPAGVPASADAVRNLTAPPEMAAGGVVPPKAANPTDSLIQSRFAALMVDVQKALDAGKLSEAHLALSTLYGKPELPAEAAKQVTDLLDQLAGTVIFSRQFYLEPPYAVQPGETIDTIAQKYNVPWELLARINGLMPPGGAITDGGVKDRPLPANAELKIVRGPFDAVVRLDKRELTLMLQGRYAGRFPVGLGHDQPTLEGSYTVREKALNPAYYGPDGVNVGANDPRNPLGHAWIGLTDRIGIHGVNDPQCVGRNDNRGTIGVADRDLQDLYGILSVGSRVTVMR